MINMHAMVMYLDHNATEINCIKMYAKCWPLDVTDVLSQFNREVRSSCTYDDQKCRHF